MKRRKARKNQGVGWNRRPVRSYELERAKQFVRTLALFLYVVFVAIGWYLYRL